MKKAEKKNKVKQLITLSLLTGACTLPLYAGHGQASMENEIRTALQSQQTRKISGTVQDALGPVIGANVSIKGTTTGTITDMDGRFELDAPQGGILVVSFIGYAAQEIPLDGKSNFVITLKEDSELLEEVVVVGYGTQKKVNLSGSVTAIEGEQIAAKPASDVLSALQGEMPGVTITRTGGQPGAENDGMQIRGYSSVNGASALVLIDGVEGDLSMLNAEDIASISVLKDAASCAIYGARAAAGVVLVTTKNGTAGKPKVSYNGYVSFNIPGNMPERIPAWEEQIFINTAHIENKGTPEWNAEKSSWIGNPNFNYRPLANGRWDLFDSVDWLGESMKSHTLQHNHSVSVSGGTDKVNYMFSANYYNKDGLLKYGPDDYKRYNLLAKMNASLSKYVDLSVNIQYQGGDKSENSYGAGNIIRWIYSNRNRQPIFQPEGENYPNIYNGDLQDNVIDIMKNAGETESKTESFIGKAQLTIKDFIKGLRINLSASRNAGYYSEKSNSRTLTWYKYNGAVQRTVNPANSLSKEKNESYHDLLEATVNYTFDLKDKHNFSILAGTSYENYRLDAIGGTARNMLSNDFFSFNYYDSSIATNSSLSDTVNTWAMMSYFGRINYNYMERYLLEANIRYDGSSRLAPAKRWKAFPSVSAAWRISEEEWFNVDWISSLKLRASWGQLGNGAVLGLYDYIPLISHTQSGVPSTYFGERWYFQESLASENKTWETVETTNLGLDFGFFNNRLSGTFEYYWKFNNDMLSALQLPSQIGIKVPNMNVGKLKTWGWDFNISWRDQIRDFSYQIGFNISDSNNKLVRYDGASYIGEGLVKLLEGYPINTIWGYQTDGFWSSREEYLQYKQDHPGYATFNDGVISGGDVKYVAQGEADHTIGVGEGTAENHGDLVCLGNITPRYLYGINLSAQWKGFDLSVMFQGVGKRDVMLEKELFPMFKSEHMPWTIHRDYWTVDNPDAYWPRLYLYKSSDFNSKPADRWLQDASYLRLKNVTLGYTIPISKKYIEKLRVYVTGQDLFEISDMLEVIDPEAKNNPGRDLYPFFRSWTVGLNLTF